MQNTDSIIQIKTPGLLNRLPPLLQAVSLPGAHMFSWTSSLCKCMSHEACCDAFCKLDADCQLVLTILDPQALIRCDS